MLHNKLATGLAGVRGRTPLHIFFFFFFHFGSAPEPEDACYLCFFLWNLHHVHSYPPQCMPRGHVLKHTFEAASVSLVVTSGEVNNVVHVFCPQDIPGSTPVQRLPLASTAVVLIWSTNTMTKKCSSTTFFLRRKLNRNKKTIKIKKQTKNVEEWLCLLWKYQISVKSAITTQPRPKDLSSKSTYRWLKRYDI